MARIYGMNLDKTELKTTESPARGILAELMRTQRK